MTNHVPYNCLSHIKHKVNLIHCLVEIKTCSDTYLRVELENVNIFFLILIYSFDIRSYLTENTKVKFNFLKFEPRKISCVRF